MTRETCAVFAEAVTATPHGPSDHRVRGLFERYSKTFGNGQLLTEDELQAMYQDQANSKEEVVRQNLFNQGLGPDLQPKVDWNSLNSETDFRLVRDSASLPRSKLSKERGLFDQMMDLVEAATGDEAEALWTLLMSLPTNDAMQAQILANDGIESLLGLSSDQIPRANGSLYRVLYCLQIIQSLVFEYKWRPESKVVAHIQEAVARPVATAPAAAKPVAQAQLPIAALQGTQTGGAYENDFPSLDALDEQTSPIGANRQTEGPPVHNYASQWGGRVREPSPEDPDEVYSLGK